MSRLFWFLFLIGCSGHREDLEHFEGVRMTIPYQILVSGRLDGADRARVQEIIHQVFELVDHHFNNWNPEAEISCFNRCGPDTIFALSEPLYALLCKADQLVTLTEGRFDPTIAPLCSLWRDALEGESFPAEAAIQEARLLTGWHHLSFAEGACVKDADGIAIDLCGLSKGYAVDLIVEKLGEAGFLDVHVCWGGEIRAAGHHPSGRPWNAALTSPQNDGIVGLIDLGDSAVATSGDYQHYWMVGDRIYSHICDPRTGYPIAIEATMVASATVTAPTCWLADGLATAAMLATSPEEAQSLIQYWEAQLPGVHFVLLYRTHLAS